MNWIELIHIFSGKWIELNWIEKYGLIDTIHFNSSQFIFKFYLFHFGSFLQSYYQLHMFKRSRSVSHILFHPGMIKETLLFTPLCCWSVRSTSVSHTSFERRLFGYNQREWYYISFVTYTYNLTPLWELRTSKGRSK